MTFPGSSVLKRISPVIAVGAVLIAMCIGISIFKDKFTFIGTQSLKVYDEFIRQIQEPPRSGRVVFVDLDEESLKEYGQWPWPRYLVSELSARILNGGAAVLSYDIVFAENDRTSPIYIKRALDKYFSLDVKIDGVPEDLLDNDKLFAQTIEQANDRVILGCFMHYSPNPPAKVEDVDLSYKQHYFFRKIKKGGAEEAWSRFIPAAEAMTLSIPVLNKAAGNNAFFNVIPDADNVIRQIPMVMTYGGKSYPSLALESLRLALGVPSGFINYDPVGGVESVRLADMVIPTDEKGQIMVWYRKLMGQDNKTFTSFPSYSARDILTGTLDCGVFSNKIVFLGTSAPGLKDLRATPITGEFSGVEVHATVVDNILSGDVLKKPWWTDAAEVMAILVVGIFITLLVYRGRALLSFLITIFAILLAIWLSQKLFTHAHYVFVPVRLVLSIVIIYPVLTVIRFWQEEKQKRQIRHMFGTMVSQDVLQYMEKNPESFSLSGHRADATMFFSDVAGFTTISEALQPERLSELLNRYLSPMTKIVMERKGYVDKYEGDLIMAEWGVPFTMEDHAVQGCLAALEQQEKLAEIRGQLKAEFGHEIKVRMGINSGTVTAGNMGSDRRFSYTVMGDAVNLARRLEPANKDYDTYICMGEGTYERAKHAIEARLLDKIIVKGKSKPVHIYELLGRKGQVPAQKMEVVSLYARGLNLHWECDWDGAMSAFEEALKLDPEDGPSRCMIARVREYKANPPESGWLGAYERLEKE